MVQEGKGGILVCYCEGCFLREEEMRELKGVFGGWGGEEGWDLQGERVLQGVGFFKGGKD